MKINLILFTTLAASVAMQWKVNYSQIQAQIDLLSPSSQNTFLTQQNRCRDDVTSRQISTASHDGSPYVIWTDYRGGRERLEPKACGRQYWLKEDPNHYNFGILFVYLVNERNQCVSPYLYREESDGSLQIVREAPECNDDQNTSSTQQNRCRDDVTSRQIVTTSHDGSPYVIWTDYRGGRERLEPKACGRQYWLKEDPNHYNFGILFVYLVNERNQCVSPYLYREESDGSLQIVREAPECTR